MKWIAGIIIALCIVLLMVMSGQADRCTDAGGTYVRTPVWYACVDEDK